MNIFDLIILNTILSLFPMLLYLLYLYTNNNFKYNKLYLILTLITSYLLLNKYGYKLNNIYIQVIYYILIGIILYFTYKIGKNILNEYLKIAELKKNEQLNLSLFKITHEIKNPIAVIKCYLDMLNIKNKKEIDKVIPIIKSEIDRILILLEDFSLMNKMKINKDIMDINMLIEEQIDKLDYCLENKDINIITSINDEIYINGDYNRLSQVILNLIKNSIESFDKDKKELIIKSKVKNKEVLITIEDNGKGINKSDLKRIKEPFYTTKLKGSGLGVSLSNEIIKAHNGNIKYISKVGIGTKVIINLPINY